MTSESVACAVAVPRDFSPDAFLAFHGRDTQAVAERVEGRCLSKGLSWHGRAACLSLRFGKRRVVGELSVDSRRPVAIAELAALLRRMLGLTQDVEAFEATHSGHPQLGPLIAAQRGLRVPLSASPFEALAWAITGQQISVAVAIVLRRKLIEAGGLRHSSGLLCHPDAAHVANLNEADLRQAGFSQAKTQTLLALSRAVASGRLPLEHWTQTLPVDEIGRRLLELRGIGPWTVSYALLRGFGWLDGSLHGDVAVRRKLQQLLGTTEPISAADTERWLAQFSPWRALVAAHLWAMPAGSRLD